MVYRHSASVLWFHLLCYCSLVQRPGILKQLFDLVGVVLFCFFQGTQLQVRRKVEIT